MCVLLVFVDSVFSDRFKGHEYDVVKSSLPSSRESGRNVLDDDIQREKKRENISVYYYGHATPENGRGKYAHIYMCIYITYELDVLTELSETTTTPWLGFNNVHGCSRRCGDVTEVKALQLLVTAKNVIAAINFMVLV
jgi:hypothetical protein